LLPNTVIFTLGILEIGSGSSANIQNALTIFGTTSKYITANYA